MLAESSGALAEVHDLVMLDLDGVVYVSGHAVAGAPECLARLRASGSHLAYITNNASRTPAAVATHLTELGIAATAEDVVTSAQAAAHLVRERFGRVRVLALGGDGLVTALDAEGHTVLAADRTVMAEEVDAVVSGYGPDIRWRDIMQAATLVRDGVPYVASNTDASLPSDRGAQPGHGVLVETIARFAAVVPLVAGKPARPLLDETRRRVGGRHPLMVGDRLDTDIAGARAADVASLLVLTGVTDLATLVAARPQERPSYVAPDLAGLFERHRRPEVERDGTVRLDDLTASTEDGRLQVTGAGPDADWWRVAVTAGWLHLDRTGTPADVTTLVAPVPPSAGHRE